MKQVPITAPNIELNGLPWFEHNGGKLWRFPTELESQVSPELWEMSKNTSGARLRFASDATALGMRVNYAPYNPHPEYKNLSRIGWAGIDLYGEGRFWRNLVPGTEAELEGNFFADLPPQRREFTIYLPLYHHLEIEHLLLSEEAEIISARSLRPPHTDRLLRHFYYPGRMRLPARAVLSGDAGRALNVDYVNLGFSGMGKGEPEVARAIAELDAACFVLDYAQNNPTVEEFAAVYQPFLDILREAHPTTPLLLTTPIYYTEELYAPGAHDFHERRRDVVRTAYRTQREAGDAHIFLLEGKDYLCNGEGQVDGGHANDLGFFWMAQALEPVLREALRLP